MNNGDVSMGKGHLNVFSEVSRTVFSAYLFLVNKQFTIK